MKSHSKSETGELGILNGQSSRAESNGDFLRLNDFGNRPLPNPMLTKTKNAPYGTPVPLETHPLGYQYTEKTPYWAAHMY